MPVETQNFKKRLEELKKSPLVKGSEQYVLMVMVYLGLYFDKNFQIQCLNLQVIHWQK